MEIKKKTLREYCASVGGQEKAAHKIGVAYATINRLLNGHEQPSQLLQARFEQLGITMEVK